MLYFHILVQDMNCVAAIGVVHFSVRGFGCALFYFRKEYENMKAKKFLAVATSIALLISMTACAGTGNEQASSADKSTSDIIDSATSSVDEHTSTESVEETSSGNDNANDESTITESSETSVADTTSSIPMKEEKIEERDVYDEDGNVVDKIKVKVVDGVTYTVGEKSDDKCILDGVPLFTNDPEFPSGDIITIVQTLIYMKGEKVTQKEIFEKYVQYHTPDEWYIEDYVKYGPTLSEEKLVQDPRLEPTDYFNGGLGNVVYYCERFFEDKSVKITKFSSQLTDIAKMYDRVIKLINENHVPVITVNYRTKNIWEWVTKEMEVQGILDGNRVFLSVGYCGEKYIIYDAKSEKFVAMDCTIDVVYSI
mgnify:CR=1 FL=1